MGVYLSQSLSSQKSMKFLSLKAHQDMRRAAYKQVQEQDIKAAQKTFEAAEHQKHIGYALALKQEGFFDIEIIPQLLHAPSLKMGELLEGIEEVSRRYQYMDAAYGSVADYEFARQVGYTPDLNEKYLKMLDTQGLITRWNSHPKGGGQVRFFRLTTRGQVALDIYRETVQAEKTDIPKTAPAK